MNKIDDILNQDEKPALLVGNGINQFGGSGGSSWKDLLGELANEFQLNLSKEEMMEVSNTEFFDLLDLARGNSKDDRLQKKFCDLMGDWEHTTYHTKIINWAKKHSAPVITVNFDENLSNSIGATKFKLGKNRITDYYPWNVYYSNKSIKDACQSFGIWHAHGIKSYSRSVRLGLTDYMGAVQRARSWVYSGEDSLRFLARSGNREWKGKDTWLDILFFKPILIFGFGFGKDESFLRWLFLERARLHIMNSDWKKTAWYVDVDRNGRSHRKPFFEGLGMKYVAVKDYAEIYESSAWQT